jgi:cell division protease FtsH
MVSGRSRPPRQAGRPRRRRRRTLGILTACAVAVLALAYAGALVLSQPNVDGERLSFSTFVELARNQRIDHARILDVDAYVVGTYTVDGQSRPYSAPYLKDTKERLISILLDTGTETEIDQQNGKRLVALATTLLPGLIVVVLLVYMILSWRQGSGLFAVRSGARRSTGGTATFADVAGQDAAVAELREITEFLRSPERFAAVGATVPKGVLLYGPPGCGKTLLARALAGEAGAHFFSISGSDFVELYQGVGAARVRDLFADARAAAPAIVFIDELDSVGRARAVTGDREPSGEQNQALNQILTEMDGFSPSEGVIVVGATNRPDVLDQALLRPGRFDRAIGLERPDAAARLAVLRVHARSRPLATDADVAAVAARAIGLTGADLASLMNEAAILVARAHRSEIGQAELEQALDRILEAPERQRRLALRGRSIGKRFVEAERVTFADVAGAGEAVAELAEVRAYLADPDRYAALGARLPRGILLSGPPGCGKTLLARAVAGEANAAFFSVAASEFVEVFVGLGPARVRDLFAEARAMAPSIVFIDEIDSIGAHRVAGGMEGGRERESALNQILVELDGFEARTGVVVMAATNRPDLLDPALVRPGRFDRHVAVPLPDRDGRAAILRLHARGKPLAPDVDLAVVARLTQGFSGADLANVLNEAALLAARGQAAAIGPDLVEEAVERAMLGVAARGTVLGEHERRIVAYHEAGHALVARSLTGVPPHKISVLPRGTALGHCTVLDGADQVVHARSALVDRIAVGLGGRVAEELVFGEPASSAAGDLQRVGDLARRMARELGMSDALGPLAFGGTAPYSDETLRAVDTAAREIADEAHDRARTVLIGVRAALDRVAAALLERETLRADDLDVLAGDLPPAPPAQPARRRARPA